MAAKASSPMTESRCRSLNKLLPDLEKKLIVGNIQSHLHVDAGGFLNEVEIIEVFSGRSRVEHVRSLFSVLKTKDNAAFGSFCLVLSNSGYGHWSKALMEEAGLDHDFKMTPHLDKARVNAILCKRQKMFKPTFTQICHEFNKLRNALVSVLEKLPPKDFKWFMNSFNDNLRGTKKNVKFEKSDMESPSNIMMALSLQKMYTQFDLEVFDVMVECLPEGNCSNFAKALDSYKDNVLRPLLEKTLSELADDAEVVSTHDDQKKQLSLAFVVPDDATFGTLMKARRYLEEEMEIREISNMRFDFGCGIVLFDIACPIEDTRKLAESFLSDRHLQQMKKLNIIVIYLLSHWAAGIADSSVYYFTETTYDMSRDPVKISSSIGERVRIPTGLETTTERIPIPCDYFRGDEDRKSGFELGIPAQVKVKTEPIRLLRDKRKYTVIVTGCTGRGKSTFCNFLFREKRFVENNPENSGGYWGGVMSTLSKAQYGVIEDPIRGVDLHIIDMPGYLATQNRTGRGHEDMATDGELVLQEFANALIHAKDGIDAIFVTLKAGERVSKEEELLMQFIEELNLWQHCILLFTHGREVGDKEEDRYQGFYKLIEAEGFRENCPVLAKMLAFTSYRFVIIESVLQEQDGNYYHSKVDEIIKAVAVVHAKLGTVINHPLLRMARNSWEMYMKKEKLEQGLQSEEQEKCKFEEKKRMTARHDKNQVTKESPQEVNLQIKLQETKQKLQEAEIQQTQLNQLEKEVTRLTLVVKTKEQELKEAKAEMRKKTKQVEMLVDSLEEYMQGSKRGASDSEPGQILVNYLKKMDGSPGKFVNAYSELEASAKKQKEVDAQLDQLSSVPSKFGLVSKHTVMTIVDAIKGGQSPMDDQRLSPSTETTEIHSFKKKT